MAPVKNQLVRIALLAQTIAGVRRDLGAIVILVSAAITLGVYDKAVSSLPVRLRPLSVTRF